MSDGPLQQIERALGTRHVGTFSAIASHSPREDVVAAANAARAANADLIVAVGGGSVVDATKVVQICLWKDVATSRRWASTPPASSALTHRASTSRRSRSA